MSYIKYFLLLPVAVWVLFNVWVYGSVVSLRALVPADTAFMRMRTERVAAERPQQQTDYRWVPYGQISPQLKKALIASEDAAFTRHNGFDWKGITQAAKRNSRNGGVRAGGSTISQQLAKNLFLNDKRSYWRKSEEALIAAMLEAAADKQRIYELYLNVIEWDYGVYGAEAAAQHFYRRPAAALDKVQAARLAARVPSPLHYADHPRDARLQRKTALILKRMNTAVIP